MRVESLYARIRSLPAKSTVTPTLLSCAER